LGGIGIVDASKNPSYNSGLAVRNKQRADCLSAALLRKKESCVQWLIEK
jgi:hypothetical protein